MSTVEEMYKVYSSQTLRPVPFLGSNAFTEELDFWTLTYLLHEGLFARRFFMKYKSFKYFMSVDEVPEGSPLSIDSYNWSNFKIDVESHLYANAMKYSELYRINVIDDEKYSLYDNYNTREIMDRDITSDTGEQSIEGSNDIGSRTDSSSRSVFPYDSSTSHPESSSGNTYGAQHNSSESSTSARHDSGTEDYTLTKVGNIGVQTVTDMISKHKNFWTTWDFIDYIFEQISKELLLVD